MALNINIHTPNSPADNCHRAQFPAVRTCHSHRLTLQWQPAAAADQDKTMQTLKTNSLPILCQFHLTLHSFCHRWDTINLQIISPLSPRWLGACLMTQAGHRRAGLAAYLYRGPSLSPQDEWRSLKNSQNADRKCFNGKWKRSDVILLSFQFVFVRQGCFMRRTPNSQIEFWRKLLSSWVGILAGGMSPCRPNFVTFHL